MRKRENVSRTNLRFEQLEGRRLLAADFAACAAVDIGPVESSPCEISSAEFPVETEIQMDVAACGQAGLEQATENLVEPGATDLPMLDLADGMDGYYGSLDADSPTETIAFSTPANGTATIVMASSFEDGDVAMTITDSSGRIIEAETDDSGVLSTTTFDAVAGETYQLTVESLTPECDGEFQVTVGFEAEIDQHADEIGSESTELQWSDNQTELEGKLESAGDVDTFRFTADADGEVMLQLNEMVENDRVDLDIQIVDSQGNAIASGRTNEILQISFDVNQGEEYFVALTAGEGQQGDYRIAMELDAIAVEPTTSGPVVEETPSTSTEPECDVVTDEAEPLAGDTAEIVDTDANVTSEPDISDQGLENSDPDCQIADVVDDAESEIGSETTEIAEQPEAVDQLEVVNDAIGEREVVVADSAESTADETPIEELLTDEADQADLLETNDAQPEVLPSSDSVVVAGENCTDDILADPTIPTDDVIEVVTDPSNDQLELPAAADNLVADVPAFPTPDDSLDLELESDEELMDETELELVDNDVTDRSGDEGVEQPITCSFADESVDEVFGELGALDLLTANDDSSQFGTFNVFGGNLNFWANGTGAGSRSV